MHLANFRFFGGAATYDLATCGALGLLVLSLTACGPEAFAPAPPSLEWNHQEYGPEPAHRPLSTVVITTEAGWVVAREKTPVPATASGGAPVYCTAHLRIGGVDCGDCQRLIADQLGMVAGIRQARISQPDAGRPPQPGSSQWQPEAVVDYDPAKVNPKQIAGTISSLGLLPQPLP
jgi:copper chaperone CopZ